jgi:hypothetical protein
MHVCKNLCTFTPWLWWCSRTLKQSSAWCWIFQTKNSASFIIKQGRRNWGGQGGQAPPKFWQVPFFRLQSALFFREKISLKLHFLPKAHFWKLQSMLFPEKCFNFGEKYHISGKFLGISGKICSYLGNFLTPKMVHWPKIFWRRGGGEFSWKPKISLSSNFPAYLMMEI